MDIGDGSRTESRLRTISLSYSPGPVLASVLTRWRNALPYLSRPRRPRRTGEWTDAKAVTFIVTLAARRSVTLAAACAGMSRKAAYALRHRDPAFAATWDAALAAHSRRVTKVMGDSKVHDPPFAPLLGDSVTLRRSRSVDAQRRDRFFANLAATRVACAPALP